MSLLRRRYRKRDEQEHERHHAQVDRELEEHRQELAKIDRQMEAAALRFGIDIRAARRAG